MKFTLTAYPGGNSILSTEEPITAEEAERIRELFERWKETEGATLIVGQMRVVTSLNLELDLETEETDEEAKTNLSLAQGEPEDA